VTTIAIFHTSPVVPDALALSAIFNLKQACASTACNVPGSALSHPPHGEIATDASDIEQALIQLLT